MNNKKSIAEISRAYIGRAADADIKRHRRDTGVIKVGAKDGGYKETGESPADVQSFKNLQQATKKRATAIKGKRQRNRNRRFNRKATEIERKTKAADADAGGIKDSSTEYEGPSLSEQAEFIRSLPPVDEQGLLRALGKGLQAGVKWGGRLMNKPVAGAKRLATAGGKLKAGVVAKAKHLGRVTKKLGAHGAGYTAWELAAAPWRLAMAGKDLAKQQGQKALNVKQAAVDTREQLEYIHSRLVEKMLGETSQGAMKKAREEEEAKKKVSKKDVKKKRLFDTPKGYRGVTRKEETEHEGPSLMETKDWIQGAVKHPGRCTPMPNPDCPVGSPQYNLGKRFKKAARKKESKGGTGWQGKV
jgi:hypothetical protein